MFLKIAHLAISFAFAALSKRQVIIHLLWALSKAHYLETLKIGQGHPSLSGLKEAKHAMQCFKRVLHILDFFCAVQWPSVLVLNFEINCGMKPLGIPKKNTLWVFNLKYRTLNLQSARNHAPTSKLAGFVLRYSLKLMYFCRL